ncbi:MAG: M20/M25/M40 family metallo-hydrolase, partial [Bdellovibrionales bacterium]|nr:M20/M25/M40 family metallo-hydrolase [Bdellovibrionales bacterium]
MPLQKVIEKNMPLYINEWLSELCAIPSIAAHNSHMTEGAEYVEKLCKLAGAHEVHSYETQNAPIIVAHFGSGEEKLLCYEHYDVQPPDPLDDWDSDPFQPHIMGDTEKFLHGKFIARGAADTKGNLVSRLAALHAYQETHGKLPLQVTLLCEGGEEIGSPDLPSFVEKHPFVVQSDYCIWESGGVSDNGAPQLYFGMKGCLYLTIRFHTMARDCHSQGANVAPSAAWLAVLVA